MRKNIIILVLILTSLEFTACGDITENVTQKIDSIEVGTEFDISTVFECKDGVTISLNQGKVVDTSKLGNITIDFVITSKNKEKEKSFDFRVIDTKAPEIYANNVTIYAGTDFDPNNCVECTDNSGENIIPSIKASDVNTVVVGNYNVIYEAIDSSGNVAERTINVEVLPIKTEEAAMDLVDEYLSKKGYDSFKYSKDKVLPAVYVTGPKLSGTSLNDDRTLKIYPQIFLSRLNLEAKYKVECLTFNMEFKDTSAQEMRYVLKSDKMDIKSESDIISVTDKIVKMGEYERNYYISKFEYSIRGDNLDKFNEMLEVGTVIMDIQPQNRISDYSTFPIKDTYITIPITYELNESDIAIMRQTMEIYNYLVEILGHGVLSEFEMSSK